MSKAEQKDRSNLQDLREQAEAILSLPPTTNAPAADDVQSLIQELLRSHSELESSNRALTMELQAERNLKRESDERFRVSFQNHPTPGYLFQRQNERFVLRDYNKAADDMTVGAVQNDLGRSLREMFADVPEVLEDCEHCFAQHTSVDRETNFHFRGESGVRQVHVTAVFAPPDYVFVHLEDKTSERTTAEALRLSEEKYRYIVETTTDWIWEMASDGTHTNSNERIEDLLGWTVSEYLSCTFRDLIHPDDLVEVERELPALIAQKQGWDRWGVRFRHKDGTYRYLESSAVPMLDNEGNLLGYCGTDRDVTDQVEINRQLAEAERRYRTLFDQSPDAIILIDPQTLKPVQFNDRAIQVMGYSREELLRMPVFHFEENETEADSIAHVQRILEQGHDEFETQIRTRDDALRDVVVQAEAVEIDGQKLLHCSCRDITESKQAEVALRQSGARLRRIINSNMIGVLFWNAKGDIIDANARFLEIIGYSEEELRAGLICWTDLTPPEYSHLDERGLREIEVTGTCAPFEKEYIRKDGTRVPILLGAAGWDEDPRSGVCFVIDISEQKQAERRLRRSEEQLRAITEGAHEFILQIDRQGICEYINRVLPDLDKATVIGSNFLDWVAPEDHRIVQNALEQVLATGEPQGYELRGAGPDDTISWYSSRMTPLFSEDQIVGAIIVSRDVTDHKKALDQLRESEATLRAVTENSVDHILLLNPDLIIQFVNRPYATKTTAELEGTPIYQWVPEEVRQPMIDSLRDVIEFQAPGRFETHWTCEEGELVWFENCAVPLLHEDQVTALVLTVRDVTEPRRITQALQESEAKLRGLLDALPDIMLRLDASGVYLDYWAPSDDMLVVPPSRFLGRNIREVIPAEVAEPMMHKVTRCLETGELQQLEYQIAVPLHSNHIKTAEARIVRMSDQDVLCLIRDTTERKDSERERERLLALIEHARDAIALSDLSGPMNFLNEAGLKLLGMKTLEQTRTTSFYDHVAEVDQVRLQQHILPAIRDNGFWRGELNFRHFITGESIPVEGNCFLIREPGSGKPMSIGGVMHDITERKRTEEALRRSERLASIGTLAAGIAHEINNPVGAALLTAETALSIREDPAQGEELTECLRRIITSMVRCRHVTGNLLGFARQEPLEKLPLDINDLIRRSMNHLEDHAKEQGVGWEIQLEESLPKIPGNPLGIELAVSNVLRNALEASRKGSFIRIRTSQTSQRVRLTIEDNGKGMNEAEAKRIFDPFFTTKQGSGGTGVGMSITHAIIESHSGSITITSIPALGTQIVIELPTSDPSESDSPQESPFADGQ